MELLSKDLMGHHFVWEPALDAAELDPNARRLSEVSGHLRRVAKTLDTNQQTAGSKGTTPEEANKTAMRLAKQDSAFVNGGAREWAAAIRKATGKTCSIATVKATRLWQETMKETGRGRSKGKSPKAVALTDAMESVVGEGERDEVLRKLIADHKANYEPSPLEDDPPTTHRKPRHYKRV